MSNHNIVSNIKFTDNQKLKEKGFHYHKQNFLNTSPNLNIARQPAFFGSQMKTEQIDALDNIVGLTKGFCHII